MASKQYISIIRLFEHCAVSTEGELNTARIKKQLNAEFDYAKTGFIEVGGFSYSKHDVLEEIEHPLFQARFVYHKKLWEHKNLLALLESNSWNVSLVEPEFADFLQDKEFDQFFSPYFAGPFNNISRNLLNDLNFYGLSKLYVYEDFLQPEEREEGFRSVRIFLDENLRLLKNTVQENYNAMRPKIKHWISGDWSVFVNRLPHEFFDFKCDMAVLLINLSVKIQKTDKEDCRSISDQLIAVQELPEHLRQTIINNHGVYHKTKSSTGWGEFRWLIWVAFILIKIIAMGGC